MLGARKGSTPLSYNLQPNAQYLFDPVTRRSVRYVETIVPTLAFAAQRNYGIPADRYYANLGVATGSASLPEWGQATSGTINYQNWDSSGKRWYLQLDAAGVWAGAGQIRFIFPTGPFGESTTHAPKNASVAAVWIKFRARFPTNADYTAYGVGASSSTTLGSVGTPHLIQVGRNVGSWELGTCDGSTISQSSGGSADGNFHDFWIRWEDGVDVKLYVDEVLTITKTTNLPTEPLGVVGINNADNIDIVDYLVEWELA